MFSLSHLRVTFLKEKDFYTEWKLQCSLKKKTKNKCRHKKLKTHTGALPTLLVHSNTGWKRERELLKVRMGFNTYRLYLNHASPFSPLQPHSLFFLCLPSPLPLLISGCLLVFSPFEVLLPLKYISGVSERQSESRCCVVGLCVCVEQHSVAVRLWSLLTELCLCCARVI